MIEKDFRAVAPVWLAVVAAVGLSSAAGHGWEWLGVAAYFLGAPAIGSYVFGHEFTHQTTGMLLTLPVPRSRIWLSKMFLAVILVGLLTAIAAYAQPLRGNGDARTAEVSLFTLTTIAGICLASWLTMLARNPLAGTVFTCSLAGVLMLIGAWIGINLYGYTKDVDDFQVLFMWATLVPLCAIGLVLGWRTFVHLEARETREAGIDLGLPRAAAPGRTTLSRRHPLRLLTLKELRLQQLAWVLAAVYVLFYVGVVLWRRGTQEADMLAQVLTMFFSATIAILLGCVTTAEERQIGTHDAQLLQPVPTWLHWGVKVGAALGSAVVLTVFLPLVLVAILPPEQRGSLPPDRTIPPQFVASMFLALSASAYVSSLSRTTMRALVGSIAVVAGMVVAWMRVLLPVHQYAWSVTHTFSGRFVHGPSLRGLEGAVFWWMLVLTFVSLVLRYAAANHRQASRSVVGIGAQIAAITLVAIAGSALAGALGVR